MSLDNFRASAIPGEPPRFKPVGRFDDAGLFMLPGEQVVFASGSTVIPPDSAGRAQTNRRGLVLIEHELREHFDGSTGEAGQGPADGLELLASGLPECVGECRFLPPPPQSLAGDPDLRREIESLLAHDARD